MNRKHFITIVFLLAGLYACKKEVIERFSSFQQPTNFPEPAYHFSTNLITKEKFELGKKLFYDNILSANKTISCASCHIPTAAFTHRDHTVSHGIYDRLGTRNSPPIMNLAWSTSFMWDGGVGDLDLQPISPITNHVEMDDNVANVLAKLKSDPQYPDLFKKAFNNNDITSADFLKALSQFMLMCVSSNSKYDSVMRHQATFTADEETGYDLFKQKCNACHTEPLFTDYSFRNNGISISGVNDMGRYLVTLNEKDKYTFKVPSLRNLDYTPPYMHDGRFFTVDAVLDHYTNGVQHTPNLDSNLLQGTQPGISITAAEKQQIVKFLKTLNDKFFITNKLLSE